MNATVATVAAGAPAPLAYAFTLGLVAAVNPCGFPLLPAYLALFARKGAASGPTERTARGLAAGASVTAGFIVVFGLLGLAVESGAQLVFGWVPWAMVPIGVVLTAVGVLAVLGRQPHLRLPVPRFSSSRGTLSMTGFGIAYAVASLSCALPLFLAGVAGSFTRLGFLAGVKTFLAYALGMGLFMTAASLVVAHAGAGSLRRVLPATRFVPRLGGAVLSVVGAYLVLYWVSDLVAPLSAPGPVRVVESVQSSVSSWLAGSYQLVGAVLAGAAVAGLVVLALSGHRPVPAVRREGEPTAKQGA